MFSISVDWSNNDGKWENLGRSIIEEACKHKKRGQGDTNMRYSGYCEKCGQHEDSCQPMMNYAYPLVTEPSDEEVLAICQRTNCTVMYNNEDDTHYLALCGGGMDLSQDIALAYIIAEKWVPFELALEVCTQEGFGTHGQDFIDVMNGCRESIEKDIEQATARLEKIKNALENVKAKKG